MRSNVSPSSSFALISNSCFIYLPTLPPWSFLLSLIHPFFLSTSPFQLAPCHQNSLPFLKKPLSHVPSLFHLFSLLPIRAQVLEALSTFVITFSAYIHDRTHQSLLSVPSVLHSVTLASSLIAQRATLSMTLSHCGPHTPF